MEMKSDRLLLVDGVTQTEFDASEHHNKEMIVQGLAAKVGAKVATDAMHDGSMTVA